MELTDTRVTAAPPPRLAHWCKEALDRLLAAVLIALCAPLLAVVAMLVAATSPGPIFYRRRVVGLHGAEFDAYKFRTMVADADRVLREHPELLHEFGRNVKLKADPRLTPVGGFLRRTSLDELPQLFNVLRGRMSLVGPRMIAPEEKPRFGDQIGKRLNVKPGMTGLWQVSGRQELGYDDRVRLDLHYIDNWSLWLDLAILARTIPAVLTMRGAY